MRTPLTAKGKSKAFDAAIDNLKALHAALKTEPAAIDRAAIYEVIAETLRTLGRTVNPEFMPPLAPGEGTSYMQVYADSAAIADLLAYGERHLGHRGPRPSGWYQTCPPAERLQWDRYFASSNRQERAELLFALEEITAARTGSEVASELNPAGWGEHAIAQGAAVTRRA